MCGSLLADTIHFKDGTSLQGQIVAEMDDFVMIRIEDGTAHKVSKETIQKIIKGEMPQTERIHKQKRFKISNMDNLSLGELETDLDSWFEKMESLHQKSAKGLQEGLVLARIGETYNFFQWLIKWYDTGPATISLDDIADLRSITKKTVRTLDSIINNGKAECRSCRGRNRIICRSCRGLGKTYGGQTRVISISKNGLGSTTKATTKRCPTCRGTGKIKCVAIFHKNAEHIKKAGGIHKVIQIEQSADKAIIEMSPIFHKANKITTAKQLRILAKKSHQLGYHYITLEILKLCKEKQ
jgi:hypothetical protein